MKFRLAVALAVFDIAGLASQAGPPVVRSQLVWFDRAGKRLGTLGDLADYGNIELSPDGRQVAVAILDPATRTHNLWVYDVAANRRTQFTSGPADENWLIWSPDGRRVIFNSQRQRGLDLYERLASGGGSEDLLLVDNDRGQWPVSWSPDGRFVLVVTNNATTGNDVWVLPLTGDRPSTRSGRPEPAEGRKPYPFLHTEAAENWASFSPDGKWVAFSSTASGRAEVYVTPFPAGGQKWVVSRDGGFQARWRRDGKELFFMGTNSMLMAASVAEKGADFEVASVQSLFTTKFAYAPYHAYDVAADGQRFLVNTAIVVSGSGTSVAH